MGSLSYILYSLSSVAVKTTILQGSNVHLKKGASINLTCIVNYSPDSSSTIVLWFHNQRIINYDNSKRIKVTIERNSNQDETDIDSSTNGESLLSHLIISDTNANDSGNYSCKPTSSSLSSYSNPAHINVHVLNGGENPAAMQRGRSSSKDLKQNSGSGLNNSTNVLRLYDFKDGCIVHALLTVLFVLYYNYSYTTNR